MNLHMFLTILQTFITAPLDRITALNTFCLLVSIGLLILTFFVMPRTNSDWKMVLYIIHVLVKQNASL